jgi:imidazolonepropionase-like amidohydrolase
VAITVYRNLRLFDGLTPGLREGLAVVVVDREIRAVEPEAALHRHAAAEIVDLDGLTLLPGLIDAHVQIAVPFIRKVNLRAVRDLWPQLRDNLRWCLETGVTTVRDMAGIPGLLARCVSEVDSGNWPGPRIVRANSFITCPHGYPDMAPDFNRLQKWILGGQFAERVSSPREARECVRRMVGLGADWVKIGHADRSYFGGRSGPLPTLSDECYRAIVDEARKLRRPVGLHHTWISGFRKGVELGVDSLEHLPYDAPLPSELADAAAAGGTALVPTLGAPAAYAELDETAAHFESEARRFLAPEPLRQTEGMLRRLQSGRLRPEDYRRECLMDADAWRARLPVGIDNLRRLRAAGVRVGCGSDAGGELVFFGTVPRELALMTRAGFSNFEVLRAATSVNAEILGMGDSLGAIEPGKKADLIAVAGDPLSDLACLRDVRLVVRSGNAVLSKPAVPAASRN